MKNPQFRAILSEVLMPDDGDTLPTEFVIFKPGDNPSTKGPAIWDDVAAASVMAFVRERGQVDFCIDLEHRSLDRAATSLTKDAADAMGWFNIELRGLELWAVNVRWTPEGAMRLREKKQRYTSPAFYWLNEENGRVGEVINVGLVSMPATHDQSALVAASRTWPITETTRERAKQILRRTKLRESVSRSKAGKR